MDVGTAPEIPTREIDRDLAAGGDHQPDQVLRIVDLAATDTRPLTASDALARRITGGLLRLVGGLDFDRCAVHGAGSSTCGSTSEAAFLASARAASKSLCSLSTKYWAPCLMARAFLMPSPVRMASLSSSSRRTSSTLL